MFVANPTKQKLTAMHFYGWEQGLKTGMYYLRSKPAASAIQFTVEGGGGEEDKDGDKDGDDDKGGGGSEEGGTEAGAGAGTGEEMSEEATIEKEFLGNNGEQNDVCLSCQA